MFLTCQLKDLFSGVFLIFTLLSKVNIKRYNLLCGGCKFFALRIIICWINICQKLWIWRSTDCVESYIFIKFVILFPLQVRYARFKSSPLVSKDESKYTGFEISRSPEEWKCVQNLLPMTVVPEPKPKAEYPSGWRPQNRRFLFFDVHAALLPKSGCTFLLCSTCSTPPELLSRNRTPPPPRLPPPPSTGARRGVASRPKRAAGCPARRRPRVLKRESPLL